MEKLNPLKNFPEIEAISSALVLSGEVKIYFTDYNKTEFELYFPNIYDFRQCVEAAFIVRNFKQSEDNHKYSIFTVENSQFIKDFIRNSVGVYGDNESVYFHYIIFDSIDTIIEVIATEPPILTRRNDAHS